MTPVAVAGAASLAGGLGMAGMAASNDPEVQKLMLQIKLKYDYYFKFWFLKNAMMLNLLKNS